MMMRDLSLHLHDRERTSPYGCLCNPARGKSFALARLLAASVGRFVFLWVASSVLSRSALWLPLRYGCRSMMYSYVYRYYTTVEPGTGLKGRGATAPARITTRASRPQEPAGRGGREGGEAP
eukprot:SAG22_NODE_1010_length_6043_cov_2.870962_4_plen_122_part_00